MKKLFFYIALFLGLTARAQTLPVVYLPANQSIHFISPEPIQYVDISARNLAGDLPLKNVFRLRLKDSLFSKTGAVVTITGETFIAQYRVLPGDVGGQTQIDISPGDTRPLDISGIGFSQNQLKSMSLAIFASSPDKKIAKVSEFGLTARLNHVYTAGDHIFLDISYHNTTQLKYDIEDIRFRIEDRKVNKASNVQTLELKPEYVLFPVPSFSRNYRNVFVFRKMSFPGNKILLAELSEKQVSGRILTLSISYRDILGADTLPN